MRTVSESFIFSIYQTLAPYLQSRFPKFPDRDFIVEYLVEVEEHNRDEVNEALDLLQWDVGYLYEPYLGKLALVRT